MNQRNEQSQKHGPWEHFYDSGQLCYKGSYLNGDKYGPWEHFYANGELQEKGSYKHGVKIGLWYESA